MVVTKKLKGHLLARSNPRLTRTKIWRKCAGVEPTALAAKDSVQFIGQRL